MRFLCVKQITQANIYGQDYALKPLDPKIENIEDILITDHTSAAELLERHPDILFEVSLKFKNNLRFPKYADKLEDIHPGDKVLIVHNGGIGDHIMLLPALHVFRERFPPDCRIWLAVQKERQPLFRLNPNIDRLLAMPLRLPELLEADCLIDFSSRRDWYDLESLPMTDAYLNFLKIDYEKITEKTPRLYWPGISSAGFPALIQKIRDTQDNSKPLVLLNWKASNRLRDMPPQKFIFLAKQFKDVFFLVAQSGHLQTETARIIHSYSDNLYDATPWMKSLEDYLAAIAHCDAVVSTDTAAGHLAEALGKPNLILYGPTRDQLWIKYYKKTLALRAEYTGKTCKSPCGLTKDTSSGCPEAVLLNSPYSPCLLSINAEKIASGFENMLKTLLR